MNIPHRVRTRLSRMKLDRQRQANIKSIDTLATLKQRNPEFASLRTEISQSGTDDLKHFQNGYSEEGGLYLQQNPDEFAALCLYLKEHRPYNNYMEIGSASGGACLFIHQKVGFTNGLSLDDGQHRRAVEQKKHFDQIPSFKQFIGDSHAAPARKFLEQNLVGKLDVAFIDGDHSYEGVWQDIRLTLPFCRPGTILIFHDTVACLGVEMAWVESVEQKLIKPLAEYIGEERPLGIGIGAVI